MLFSFSNNKKMSSINEKSSKIFKKNNKMTHELRVSIIFLISDYKLFSK